MTELSSERFARLRSLFHCLLEATPETRRAELARVAAADAELAQLARRLLDDADTQIDADGAPPADAGLAPGTVVAGRYRILRLLGEGGMGAVHLAERVDDIAQKVALKRMRSGSAALHKRFLRERQILARLSHPNIAHLVDGGLTDAGVPWFAMEYVDGAALTEACDRQRLDLRARVRLLAQVCRAVQFAHRNLVLHRDLKPSNILLDAEGVPKLLDFGIARLLDDTAADRPQTVTMTPAYAAPEQLRGEAVTTASDVYQLGLVLYELLGGVSAHELRRRRALARETTKSLPRLEQAYAQCDAQHAARIAAERGLAPPRLARALRGDLGRIVAKATADDPRERYDGAQALAEDLERWLAGLAVLAQRGSLGYRLGKLLRRHAYAAAAIALLGVGLVASSVVAINRAGHEREQRRRAQTVVAFMRDVFRQGDPQNAGADARPVDLLERAAVRLEARREVDDVTRAVLLGEIAGVFQALGRDDEAMPRAARAVEMLEPVREAHAEEYLSAAGNLIEALRALDTSAREVELIEHALPLARRTPGGERLWYGVFLAYRGYAQFQREDNEGAAASLDAAIAEFERDSARSLDDLGGALYQRAFVAVDRGDIRGGILLYQRALDAHDRAAEGSRFSRLATEEVMARAYCLLGDTATGIERQRSAVERLGAMLGPTHGRVVMSRVNLVQCRLNHADYAAAAAELDEVQAARRGGSVLTPLQGAFVDQVATRLDLYRLRTDAALAGARAIEDSLRALQPPRRYLMRADMLLGESLLQAGRCEQAGPVLQEALRYAQALSAGTPNAHVGEIQDSLGRCALVQGRHDDAQHWFGQAIAQFSAAQVDGAPSRVRSEIHRLWSRALATHDAAALEALSVQRAALVAATGGEDVAQVRQFDLLLDEVRAGFGLPPADPARSARAAAGLQALAGSAQTPRFVGLNGFW
jgi:serine/threonine-protein kinase